MEKKYIILVMFLALVLVFSGCQKTPTSARATNPEDCLGDQACIDCVTQPHYCSGDYIKAYSYSNGLCGGDVIWQYCPDGCSLGVCIGDVSKDCLEANPLNICKAEGVTPYGDYKIDTSLICADYMPVCWTPISLSVCDKLEEMGYIDCIEKQEGVCSGDDLYYCTEGNVYTAIQYGTRYYFCTLSSSPVKATFTTCPNGCINGECAQQVCLPNAQWCEGNILKACSSDGKTIKTIQTCTGSQVCEERSIYSAICRIPDNKFCLNNNFECISCSNINGYSTLEECRGAIVYYCLSKDKSYCTKREGSCLLGELYYKGTDLEAVRLSCERQVCGKEGNECCTDDACDSGLICKEKVGYTSSDGSPYMICVKEGREDICSSECSKEAYLAFDDNVIVPNYICIWKCQLKAYFMPLFIGISIISALIIFLITFAIMRSKFRKKKDAVLHWIVSLIFSIAFGLALFFYFWMFVIGLILYIAIMVMILIIKK